MPKYCSSSKTRSSSLDGEEWKIIVKLSNAQVIKVTGATSKISKGIPKSKTFFSTHIPKTLNFWEFVEKIKWTNNNIYKKKSVIRNSVKFCWNFTGNVWAEYLKGEVSWVLFQKFRLPIISGWFDCIISLTLCITFK